MRVFLTGATGFVGSAIVGELIGAGHSVLGLARSEAAAETLKGRGVEPHRGELADLDSLAAGARACDGVIHTAFVHEFDRHAENIETDRRAVAAMLAALEGSGKPFVLTSGTALAKSEGPVTELDAPGGEGGFALRGATEIVALDAAARGVRPIVMRLPQVHGRGDHGFVPRLIEIAKETGVAAYVGDGANRWPTVHRFDAARLYRLALERAEAGTRLHAVAEEGVALKAISQTISEGLGVPARSITPDEAGEHFGWLAWIAAADNPTSSEITRRTMGWTPVEADLLTDMRQGGYFD
ncbi:SDR family oxidoreductase [Phenylobacterium sp.]|uniref:SDR family oxidoreductase n=1 Tax=Phenylobacterium sp. TaxID=1871053 RepID=UPI0035AD8835